MKTQSDYSVMMSDAEGMVYYTLLGQTKEGSTVNCISGYTISGGPETPFEILSITVSKQKLKYIAPKLIEEDEDTKEIGIRAGRNEIIVDAVGKGHFTVVKCKYSGRKYKITAYCNAERYKGCTIKQGGTDTPEGWIRSILTDVSYGVSLDGIELRPGSDAITDQISFEGGTVVWYILQVCAILLGCKIWFAEDKAYIVDCTALSGGMDLELYPESKTDMMYARTLGEVTLGSEGTDTLINSVAVKCTVPVPKTSAEDTSASETRQAVIETVRDAQSIAKYGESKSSTLVVPELKEGKFIQEDGSTVQYTQGSMFAKNYMKYLLEPQQSVTFELKELQIAEDGHDCEWVQFWDLPAYCESISDTVDEFTVLCRSTINSGSKPEKLLLSTYVRNYPNGTSEYTFGQIKSIDLSSSTSQIVTALYN